MAFPRPPDWLIYSSVVFVLVTVSLARRENADALDVPGADDEIEGELLGPVTAFDPAVTVNAPDIPFQPSAGTAFSVARDGLWITARHVVEGCRRPAIMVAEGRAVSADVRLASRADIAVMITDGGPPALPVLVDGRLHVGQRGFAPQMASISGFRLEIGMRASRISQTASTSFKSSSIIRRVLVI